MLIEEGKAVTHTALVADLADRGAEVLVAPRSVIATTVGFDLHRGVVAVAERGEPLAPADVLAAAGDAPILAVEGVNDHENLGSLFRNAAALGAGGVLLSPGCADPLYRRSVRVSIGHVLLTPFATVPSWPSDLTGLGRELIALTPAGSDDLGRWRPRGAAVLVVGSEGAGLAAATLAAADRRVRIPMAPGVDSLNVATAAAIALYALRQ
jgi:tRNA G18 (ribose-2'-O)-methylase SpoU